MRVSTALPPRQVSWNDRPRQFSSDTRQLAKALNKAGRRAFSPAAPVTRRYAAGPVSTEAAAIDPVPAGPALGIHRRLAPGLDVGHSWRRAHHAPEPLW